MHKNTLPGDSSPDSVSAYVPVRVFVDGTIQSNCIIYCVSSKVRKSARYYATEHRWYCAIESEGPAHSAQGPYTLND